MKKILLCQLAFLLSNFTCIGEDITRVNIYNYKSGLISIHYKKSFYDDLGIPEKIININPNSMSFISDSGKAKPISKSLFYVVVKNTNSNEILNLSGEALDNAFRVEEETDSLIVYRMDVN